MLARWRDELTRADHTKREAELSRRQHEWLDQGHGSCVFRDDACAEIVEKALLHFDEQRYRLFAWVVMPNHVHCVVDMHPEWSVSEVVHSWKSFTAKEINRHRGTSGTMWQPEYHDRCIRNAEHFQAAVRYVHDNPVQARLVERPDEYRWSSAWQGRAAAKDVWSEDWKELVTGRRESAGDRSHSGVKKNQGNEGGAT